MYVRVLLYNFLGFHSCIRNRRVQLILLAAAWERRDVVIYHSSVIMVHNLQDSLQIVKQQEMATKRNT